MSDVAAVGVAVEDRIAVASNWKLVWWRFRRHHLAMVSACILICLYLVVLCPEFFSTQNPEQTDARQAFIPVQTLHFFDDGLNPWVPEIAGKRNPVTLRMEWTTDPERKVHVRFFTRGEPYRVLGLFETDIHLIEAADPGQRIFLLGSDRLGRDQWSRIMRGTQTSMTVGLVAVTLSVVFGVVLGGISGYFGGVIDMVIQRLIELLQSVPTIPIWLALSAALPRDWTPIQVFFAITVILSLIGWTTLAREVRGRFLALREEDFVLAARLAGCSRMRIILRHMVPTFLSHIIATSSLAIPVMIINENVAFLPRPRHPPAGYKLGRAAAGGAEHPDAGAGAVAAHPGADCHRHSAGVQPGGRRAARCRRSLQPLSRCCRCATCAWRSAWTKARCARSTA